MEQLYSMVISTCATAEEARKIAKLLVEKHLAACVQMFPIESIYTWQDRLCEEKEIMIFIKTRIELTDQVEQEIKKNHSYDVPEIIDIPIDGGLPEYLSWIGESTNCYDRQFSSSGGLSANK